MKNWLTKMICLVLLISTLCALFPIPYVQAETTATPPSKAQLEQQIQAERAKIQNDLKSKQDAYDAAVKDCEGANWPLKTDCDKSVFMTQDRQRRIDNRNTTGVNLRNAENTFATENRNLNDAEAKLQQGDLDGASKDINKGTQKSDNVQKNTKDTTPEPPGVCSFSLTSGQSFDFIVCIKNGFAWIAYIVITLVSLLVGISGMLFDSVLTYTIVDITKNLTNLSVINDGWIIFRDVGNFIFIFVLVYIAIRTILGIDTGDTKRLIRNVIIIGLLVNFSLFFTKFLIDVSNVFSLSFYNKMLGGGTGTFKSFTATFTQPLGIGNIFDPNSFIKQFDGTGADAFIKIGVYGIGGSIFLLFVAFSFLYASILFILRYIVLILLMIISPVAFFAFIVPSTKKYFDQWKNTLIGMLSFAPLYLLLMMLVRVIASTLSGTTNGTLNISTILSDPKQGTINPDSMTAILIFIVLIGLINAAAILATKIASNSGGLVSNIVNSASNAVAPKRMVQRSAGLATQATASTTGYSMRTLVGGRAAAKIAPGSASRAQIDRDLASKNIFTRAKARTKLAINEKAANATFDLRNTKTVQGVAKMTGVNTGIGAQDGYAGTVAKEKARILKDAESRGGASVETQEKLDATNDTLEKANLEYANAQMGIREHEQAKAKATKKGDTAAVAEHQEKINKHKNDSYNAQKAIRDAEKAKKEAEKQAKKDKEQQQLEYLMHQKKNRFNRTGPVKTIFGHQAAWDQATQDFIKSKRQTSESDIQKAEAEEFANRLKAATDQNDYTEAKKMFATEIQDGHIKKIPGKTYITKGTDGKEIANKELIKSISKRQRNLIYGRGSKDTVNLTEEQRNMIENMVKEVDDEEQKEAAKNKPTNPQP